MKEKIIITIDYLVGSFGVILLVFGYLLTTGELNLMSINNSLGAKPADLFGSPVVVILFIALPALLVKNTIGKHMNLFNFSNKFMVFLVVFSLFTGITASVGKTYNYFTYVDEDITKSYEDIDILYKKRIDLTTRVEKTLKDYMEYEGDTFTNIAQARNRYFNANSVNEKVEAANNLDKGLKSLMVVVESYPELKANQTVAQFVEVTITSEEDIANYKQKYNEKVRSYNTNLKSFPTVIVARAFGLEQKAYFEENNLDVKDFIDNEVE